MTCGKCGNCKGICPVTFGLALGITYGLFMMVLAWVATWFGWGSSVVDQYSAILSGYDASFVGGLIGFLWGLLKGFVFGFVLIMIYHLICCCKKKCCGNGNKCGCCGCCGSQECKTQ
jgi:hypothetical protein